MAANNARPVVQPVPEQSTALNWGTWATRLARTVNLILRGKLNAVTTVTLGVSVTETPLVDERIGLFSAVHLSPITDNAAQADVMGIWTEMADGSCTIHHASFAAADQTFRVIILG